MEVKKKYKKMLRCLGGGIEKTLKSILSSEVAMVVVDQSKGTYFPCP